jgi:hypothetical protein
MTEATRRELCDVFLQILQRFPDWRFGQLVENMSVAAESTPYDVEDADLMRVARSFLDYNRDRIPAPAETSGTDAA